MHIEPNCPINPIGVMQGRLLPKYQGRYQAHPVGYWQAEFSLARELGLNCIEFILDYNEYSLNPLMSEKGLDEILKLSEETGVRVHTVCADYFMEAPLHSVHAHVSEKSQEVLRTLLNHGRALGLSDIVMPCVDQSSLTDATCKERFVSTIEPLVDLAASSGINIALETDLPPEQFAELLDRFNSRQVTVNYDIGNSASLGFDPQEEIACYGDRISDIHIKDREKGGRSVRLGSGNADFDRFFSALSKVDFRGPFIMQAFRDDEGISIFKQHLAWIRGNYLKI